MICSTNHSSWTQARPYRICDCSCCLNIRFSDGLRYTKVTGVKYNIPNAPRTVSVVARGANPLILDEAERSLHDAMCVIRCLVKKRALLPGGGAPEMAVSTQLAQMSTTAAYPDTTCFKAFADALEIVPVTLAENAGLNSIKVVTELRARQAKGETNVGVSIKRGGVGVMGGEDSKDAASGEGVMQPLLVSTSAIELASETVKMILRIDDIALSR